MLQSSGPRPARLTDTSRGDNDGFFQAPGHMGHFRGESRLSLNQRAGGGDYWTRGWGGQVRPSSAASHLCLPPAVWLQNRTLYKSQSCPVLLALIEMDLSVAEKWRWRELVWGDVTQRGLGWSTEGSAWGGVVVGRACVVQHEAHNRNHCT